MAKSHRTGGHRCIIGGTRDLPTGNRISGLCRINNGLAIHNMITEVGRLSYPQASGPQSWEGSPAVRGLDVQRVQHLTRCQLRPSACATRRSCDP